MKNIATVLSTLLVSFSASAIGNSAIAEELPLKLYIDIPRHSKEIANINSNGILNPARDEFPIRFTNTSTKPLWFYGYSPKFPLYSYYSRPKDSNFWGISVNAWCNNGVSAYMIHPGVTIGFPVFVSKQYKGQQIKVDFKVYASPTSSKSIRVSSEPILIE